MLAVESITGTPREVRLPVDLVERAQRDGAAVGHFELGDGVEELDLGNGWRAVSFGPEEWGFDQPDVLLYDTSRFTNPRLVAQTALNRRFEGFSQALPLRSDAIIADKVEAR